MLVTNFSQFHPSRFICLCNDPHVQGRPLRVKLPLPFRNEATALVVGFLSWFTAYLISLFKLTLSAHCEASSLRLFFDFACIYSRDRVFPIGPTRFRQARLTLACICRRSLSAYIAITLNSTFEISDMRLPRLAI